MNWRLSGKLEPFGAGNSEPKLMLKNVKVVKPGLVGVGHVRCVLTSDNGGNLKAMAFRSADNEIGQALLKSRGEALTLWAFCAKIPGVGEIRYSLLSTTSENAHNGRIKRFMWGYKQDKREKIWLMKK